VFSFIHSIAILCIVFICSVNKLKEEDPGNCRVVRSSVRERRGRTRETPADGCKDDEGTGAPHM